MSDPLWRQGLGPALTWATIVWKATTNQDYGRIISVPELGRLAGPVLLKAPGTWGAVKGPIGAAVMSLRRVGWRFDNSLTLISDTGERFPLPSTSPALLAYHLQVSWKRRLGRDAARSIGMEGEQIDPTAFHQHQRRSQQGQAFPLLKAFMTQAVWSPYRLHQAGYSIETSCPHCGAERDTIGHRLFTCPATADLREEHFDSGLLQSILDSPASRHLLLGFQLLPPPLVTPPPGLGHEQHEVWTRSGAPIEEILEGEVFTDGSCFKTGPVTWHRTGWAICKVSEEGELMGYMRGVVGSGLPQTSPAAEHVAGLAAAAAPGGLVACALSDYQGLAHLQDKAPWIVYARQQIYAGVKLQILGRAPRGFRIEKVKGHTELNATLTARERYLAIGNDHADRNARAAADQQPQPSAQELQEHERQARFLHQYFAYVPRALARWPAVGPALGKKPLPRRESGSTARTSRGSQASFLADVFSEHPTVLQRRASGATQDAAGPARPDQERPPRSGAAPAESGTAQEAEPTDSPRAASRPAAVAQQDSSTPAGPPGATQAAEPPQPPVAVADVRSGQTAQGAAPTSRAQHSQSQRTYKLVSPPTHEPQQSAPPEEDAPAEGHDWVQVQTRWTCRSCLSISRAPFPPQGQCPGLAPSLADLVRDPRGHTLQIAPYSDRSGVVIICSKCGHFAASKRRNTKLHTDLCRRRFESDGAQFAYRRVCERKHPTYSKGEARILESAFSASALVAPSLGGAAGPTEGHHT